ncbi:MAG: helix-turn-helix domain-containing protein [[Clostridium] scindens]
MNPSQGQMAKEAGISKAMLSDIEKGGSNPTINTIWKIANGLNVPYTKLMDGIDDEATVVQRKDTIEQPESPALIGYTAISRQRLHETSSYFTVNWMDILRINPLAIPRNRRSISMS